MPTTEKIPQSSRYKFCTLFFSSLWQISTWANFHLKRLNERVCFPGKKIKMQKIVRFLASTKKEITLIISRKLNQRASSQWQSELSAYTVHCLFLLLSTFLRLRLCSHWNTCIWNIFFSSHSCQKPSKYINKRKIKRDQKEN